MSEYFSVKEAATLLGVCVKTLHRWDKSGFLTAQWRTEGGHRRYGFTQLKTIQGHADPDKITVLYARVSSHDQKEDLGRQADLLAKVAEKDGIHNSICIKDLGSGMNFKKRGFVQLLSMLFKGEVGQIIITHKDRLTRFGFGLIERICQYLNVSIRVLDSSKIDFTTQLVQDMIEVVTVFSARLHGKRAATHRELRQQATC
jgi:putative resolvase